MDSVRIVFYTTSEYPAQYVFEGPEFNDCQYKLGKLYIETRQETRRLQELLSDSETNPDNIHMFAIDNR